MVDQILHDAENCVVLDKKDYWELEEKIKGLGKGFDELENRLRKLGEKIKEVRDMKVSSTGGKE